MAEDVNEQIFSEKQLYNSDVLAEDGGNAWLKAPCELPSIEQGNAFSVVGGDVSSDKSGSKAKGILSVSEKRRKKAAERATKIIYWLETKYDVLHEVSASFENWKEAATVTSDFDLLWCDQAIGADRFMKLKPYQKMNHFVGMSAITRKNNMGRNLLRMRKQFPQEYKFFPDTWILPTDLSDFKLQFTPAKNKTFIIKPDNGCQGKGIFLIRDVDRVPVDFSTSYVAQRYIHKPFLLDGHKFDLRLYVLVMGCDPLRIFLHKRGLVRLASEQYVEPTMKNLSNTTVHLTNYAVNKTNPNFEENTNPDDPSDGHKRSWEAVADYLRKQNLDVDTMMKEIEDLLIKTLIAVQPSLSHFYHSCQPDDVENSMCFEILGFDVMLDYKLQPWLLEVNHAPSFGTESELDKMVKDEVIRDAFVLLNLSPETRRRHKREVREKMEQRAMGEAKKRSLEERSQEEHEIAKERTAWEDANLNGYKRLYPSEEKERDYKEIHDAAINIWDMLMGGNSRRSVRLTHENPEVSDEATGSKGKKTNEAESKTASKEKRSAHEMREVVERLSAGCSARPRQKTRRRGSNSTYASPGLAGVYTTDVSDNIIGSDDGKMQGERPTKATDTRGTSIRPEVHLGDVVKVQTNLGWESVVVKAKRTNGKIDIQFKDGEYMRSVLPRILREPEQKEGDPHKHEQDRHHVPLASPSPRGPSGKEEATPDCGTVGKIVGGTSVGSLSAASGILASAVSAIASSVVSMDINSSSSQDIKVDDILTPLSSITSDGGSLAQHRCHRNRAPNAVPAGPSDAPAFAGLPQAQPAASVGRGMRMPPTNPSGATVVHKVHEVRLRNQLQQLISVRPIVTKRNKGTHETDLLKSPRSGARRHTFGSHG